MMIADLRITIHLPHASEAESEKICDALDGLFLDLIVEQFLSDRGISTETMPGLRIQIKD